MVCAHQVPDSHPETLIQKYLPCKSFAKNINKVCMHTETATRNIFAILYAVTHVVVAEPYITKRMNAFLWPPKAVNGVIDRSEATRQYARKRNKNTNIYALRACNRKVLTTHVHTDAEKKESNSSTLADFSTVISLDPTPGARNKRFANFLQR